MGNTNKDTKGLNYNMPHKTLKIISQSTAGAVSTQLLRDYLPQTTPGALHLDGSEWDIYAEDNTCDDYWGKVDDPYCGKCMSCYEGLLNDMACAAADYKYVGWRVYSDGNKVYKLSLEKQIEKLGKALAEEYGGNFSWCDDV